MHTVSTYPMKDENANLRVIETLKKRYNCPVGYSGHETGIAISFAAASMGISCIERHITLDRSMYGTDQSASLSEQGMSQISNILFRMPNILGNGIKKITADEKKLIQKFKYW